MYAIVDIETTGGRAKGEKITEIAIFLHNGQEITDEFSTLINPERKIPYRITQITGIDDKMVRTAPKFYEVARKIFEMTQNRIFVAHNVNFDFGFLKQEFESLGGTFKRKKLCTVQLSRKYLPGQPSYSLGRLCQNLDIVIEGRHRARGDAAATVKLFEILLAQQALEKNDLFTDQQLRDLNSVINLEMLSDLPTTTGVYYFYDGDDELIYVGKSVNIRSRVISHLGNNATKKAIEMKQHIARIDYEETGSELVALLKESNEIKTKQPKYNRSQKRTYYSYGIALHTDDQGYQCLTVERLNTRIRPLTSFSTKMTAREHLFRIVERYGLCQRLSGLYHSSGACFQHSLKMCNGACVGEESPEAFNARVQEAVQALEYRHQNFVIFDRGRSMEEKSVILVENGVYQGFGFIDDSMQISDPSEFKDVVRPYEDNRDIQQIIRSFINQKKVERLVNFD